MIVDIHGLDKAAVLAALYNASQPIGMGLMHYTVADMTVPEAALLIKQRKQEKGERYGTGLYDFDYVHGRVMKIGVECDDMEVELYDRDNGSGAAARVVARLR